MSSTLSVIVPTLNEAATLSNLLLALQAQTRSPDEVVIADAGSQDGTVKVAREFGAVVVPGGKPGPERNAGALAASGDLFLFLDADVIPPPDFVEKLLSEFVASGCGVATTLQEPLSKNISDKILIEVANIYLQMLQYFSPHAPGYCIIIRREIHEAIDGFDEAAVLAEDYDYVQRAAKFGRFGVLTSVHIPVSMRRLEEDGFMQVAFKYVWCEMYALAGKPIYAVPFEYKFGEHLPPGATTRQVIDIAQLREQLGRFANPLRNLSEAGREQLERLARQDWLQSVPEHLRLQLNTHDAEVLYRYLRRRLTLIDAKESLRAGWSKLKALPQESLRVLDFQWLRGRFSGKDQTDESSDTE